MKYFIEDTTLTDIADAVREKEESTQPIPVVELAERIREIKPGAQIGVTLNDDGTQNLFITENGDLPDLAAVTADADANAEDVLYGKTFYAMGVKKVGSLTEDILAKQFAPVLLWENPEPNTEFKAQTVSLNANEYDAFIVQQAPSKSSVDVIVTFYVPFGFTGRLCSNVSSSSTTREYTSVSKGGIVFGGGYSGTSSNNSSGIPVRIWGAKFAL